jgi:hypothetical protein
MFNVHVIKSFKDQVGLYLRSGLRQGSCSRLALTGENHPVSRNGCHPSFSKEECRDIKEHAHFRSRLCLGGQCPRALMVN